MPKAKALVLLSGGLDSMLAAKILINQGIEVTGLTFISYFFGARKARIAAEQIGIELKEVNFSDEHLKMVKNPKYGYGKNINPCIDCHSLMLRHAKKIMNDEGYDFIATGEVLGQRPMSQNKEALRLVAEYSGVGEKLVRPLSARRLNITKPEKAGTIIRGKLLNISGRTRDKQLELVKKYKIKEYSSAAGGCLLTDPIFSDRLIKIFDYWPDCKGNDVELLKYGRVFWINAKDNKALVIVGRNKEECEKLKGLAIKGDMVIELKEIAGPLTVVRIPNFQFLISKQKIVEINIPKKLKMSELRFDKEMSEEYILQVAGLLTGWYATKARGKKVNLQLSIKN